MPRQSHPPPRVSGVLLTRPAAQGERFAGDLRARFGAGLRIVASPLLVPRFLDTPVPAGPFTAVIFTSETGVAASAPHRAALPAQAWCVGDRTAQAAAEAGFEARSTAGDASDLIRAILCSGLSGPLLHLRGRQSRGDVAATLTAAGVPTREHVVYDQRPLPLSAEAVALLSAQNPVVAPVFSPRTAHLLATERDRLALPAPLRVVALSPTVAADVAARPGDRTSIAARPDAAAMLDAVVDVLGMG